MQTLIILLLFNVVLSIIQNTRLILDFFEGADFARAIYASNVPTSQVIDNPMAVISLLPEIIDISVDEIGLIAVAGIETTRSSANLVLYNDRLLRTFSLPLSQGSWLKPSEGNQGPIPAVISHDLSMFYDVGDVLSAEIVSFISPASQRVEIEVVGILSQNSRILSGGYWSTKMSLESIYKKLAVKTIILPLDWPQLNELPHLYQEGYFLFVDEEHDLVTTYNTWAEKLADVVTIISVEEMARNHIDEIRYPLTFYTSILIVIFFLALAGIGGNNAIMLMQFAKECSIYFICGCKWSWCVIMLSIQNLLMFIIPMVLALVLLANSQALSNEFMLFNFCNYFFSVILVVFIFVVTSLEPLISLAKKAPVSILRRYD